MKLIKGDIFEAYVRNGKKKQFFQYLANDIHCLSGNVIRVFDFEVPVEEEVGIDQILQRPIKIIQHTFISGGIKLKVWKKIGNRPLPMDFQLPYFRQTNDFLSEVRVSNNWNIWQVGREMKKVGRLNDEYRKYPVAGIRHPLDLIEWMETGVDDFKNPE